MGNAIETYYENGKWKNRVQGNKRASNVSDTKEESVRLGKEMARKAQTEHKIKNKDGTYSYSNSYGKDPHPPKG